MTIANDDLDLFLLDLARIRLTTWRVLITPRKHALESPEWVECARIGLVFLSRRALTKNGVWALEMLMKLAKRGAAWSPEVMRDNFAAEFGVKGQLLDAVMYLVEHAAEAEAVLSAAATKGKRA